MALIEEVAQQPSRDQGRAGRIAAPALVIGGLAAATLALRLRDPHAHGSWGLCPSAALGVWCPMCGGLRAVNDLTHGDLPGALSSNVVVVSLMPIAVLLLARWFLDAWRGARRAPWPHTNSALIAGSLVLLVFTVLRNLPAGSWLAP